MGSIPQHLAWLPLVAGILVFCAIAGYGAYGAMSMRNQGATWRFTALVFCAAVVLGLGMAGFTMSVFKTLYTPVPADERDSRPGETSP